MGKSLPLLSPRATLATDSEMANCEHTNDFQAVFIA